MVHILPLRAITLLHARRNDNQFFKKIIKSNKKSCQGVTIIEGVQSSFRLEKIRHVY